MDLDALEGEGGKERSLQNCDPEEESVAWDCAL